MPIQFQNLPQIRGAQSLLDFSPLINGLGNYTKGVDAAAANTERLADKSTADRETKMGKIAARAQAVVGQADPARRAAMWGSTLKAFGDTSKMSPEELDPATGPDLLMAEYGKYKSPIESQTEQAKLGLIQAQTNRANARAAAGPAAANKPPPGYRWTPDGNQEVIPGGPGDKNTTTIKTEGTKVAQAYDNLVPALDEYDKLVQRTGAAVLPGQDKDNVIQQRRNIQLQLKELYNLGVLNGPDLELMDKMLYDPSVNSPLDMTNAYDPAGRTTRSVKQLKNMLVGIRNNKTRVLGMPDVIAEPDVAPGSSTSQPTMPPIGNPRGGMSTQAPAAPNGLQLPPGFKYIGPAP